VIAQHTRETTLPGAQRGQEGMARLPRPKPHARAHGRAVVFVLGAAVPMIACPRCKWRPRSWLFGSDDARSGIGVTRECASDLPVVPGAHRGRQIRHPLRELILS
jgi:hypothetical protein